MKVLKYLSLAMVLMISILVVVSTTYEAIPEPEEMPAVAEFILEEDAPSIPSSLPLPDRVTLTITETPATSMMVQWRTNTQVKESLVEFRDKEAPEDLLETLSAKSRAWDQDGKLSIHHNAEMTNLQPATTYTYRVGDGTFWSDWYEFTTASDKAEPFSFTFFGDVQAGFANQWAAVMRNVRKDSPDSKLMLFVGDLVDEAGLDEEWQAFYQVAAPAFAEQPIAVTPGNHEYDGDTLEQAWNAQFSFPRNGPERRKTLENTAYYFDYQGVRFISVNTNVMRGITLIDTLQQRSWLKELLENNPNQWTIVFHHVPVETTTKDGSDSPELKFFFSSLYKEYRVDLVLQGDDHTYARGQDYNRRHELKGPVYIVSNSGGKMEEAEAKWATVTGGNVALYQILSVDGNTLKYQSKTTDGQLFDEFEIVKGDSVTIMKENPYTLSYKP